jgi:F-type H+-transporting ATPase subunit delta
MRNITVAKRYARALYELAQETRSVDDVLRGMGNVVTELKNVPAFAKALQNPLIKPSEKADLVKTITSNKLILKCVELLAHRKRLGLFADIAEQLSHLSDAELGIRRVLVKSAATLSETQMREIEKNLASVLGGKVMGQFEMAANLLGGLWVKAGDKVLDMSVRGRFDDLRHHLAHSAN